MSTFYYLSFLLTYIFCVYPTNAGTFSVDYNNHYFVKDGKPWQYISGSIHYFRIHPDLWEDRLAKVRALGLNAIQVYTAWVLHEPTPGNFDFSSPGLNITQFFTLAQKQNLSVLLRPGPYICAETDFGMLPWWLLNYDGIKLRTYEANYINAVQNYWNRLFDEIKSLTYKNGGPIIMVQVENEYGVLGVCDHNYTEYLRDLIWNKLGNDTVLYTTDQTNDHVLSCGAVPGALSTVDFGPTSDANIENSFFKLQQKHANGGPRVVSEYWVTGMPHWGETQPKTYNKEQIADNIQFMHSINASINIYMIHGGTNFGFNNGGTISTNYGVCPPIAENGDITPEYTAIRSMIQNLTNWEQPPLAIPNNNPMANYGQVTMTRIGANLISTLTQIQETCASSTYPLTFEQINHGFGYVLYTHVLKSAGSLLAIHYIKDYGYVFVNNVYKGMVGWDKVNNITLNANSGDILRILVENGGRGNYWGSYLPTLEYRGLFNITLEGAWLTDWYQCGINLTEASINSLSNSFTIQNGANVDPEKTVSQPGVFIGNFDASALQDTFFDSTGWGKGQLFVNGFNIGRYWPQAGPQITLYVPKPIIKPKNTVVLIELTGSQQNFVNFIDHPIFYYKNITVNHWGCNLS